MTERIHLRYVEVACPKCQALPSERCRSFSGYTYRAYVHAAREERWWEQNRGCV